MAVLVDAEFDAEGMADAIATLAEAKVTGKIVGFSHRSAAQIQIYALVTVMKSGGKVIQKGRAAETGSLILWIPVQPGIVQMTTAQRSITYGDEFEWPYGTGRKF